MIPSQLLSLANHLWQSTLFAAAAGLLALALRRNRAQIRYSLWLVASVKFLIPFSVLVMMGSHFAPHTRPHFMPTAAQSAIPLVVKEVSQPFAGTVPFAAMPLAQPSFPRLIPNLLGVLWAIGFVIAGTAWWRRWRQVRAALLTATPLRLLIGIEVKSSPEFIEPGVFGVWRPILLLPDGITDHLTPAELDAILAHELCHIRRRDNLVATVHMAVEALFWFHPLVWWLGARLMEERERACDEEVLRMGSEPAEYAEGILKICELYSASTLPCAAGVTGGNLRKRIEEIMANHIGIRLSFAKKALLAAVGSAVVAAPISVGIINPPFIRAQSATASRARFEVASIKRSSSCSASDTIYGALLTQSPGRLTLNCATVAGLILGAYSRYADGRTNFSLPPLILGGPSWISSERYTINAESEGHEDRATMNGPMLQALLGDRFKLSMHRQIRQVPVLALTVTKPGAKLKPFPQGTCIPVDYARNPPPQAPGQPPFCQNRIRNAAVNLRTVHMPGATVTTFSELLGVILGRPIIDRTGIKGRFDFDVEFAIDQSTPGFASDATPADPTSGVSIFTAVQEQLGLKLQSTKGPREFLVIDHVERPSEN